MIYLLTDHPLYYSDLSEEIRLFSGIGEVALVEQSEGKPALLPEDLLCCVTAEKGCARAEVTDGAGGCWTGVEETLGSDLSDVSPDDALSIKKYTKRAMKNAIYRALREKYGHGAPWGSLTGIRPTKLTREFIAQGGAAYARTLLRERFDVSEEKLDLAFRILRVQEPVLASQSEKDFDLYIGVPFCVTRCVYCSFAAYEVGKGCATADNIEAYVALLETEIPQNVALALQNGYRLRSLYIGGGTPTALSCGQLERLICAALSACGGFGLEFTVEAGRPDTITEEKLRMLKRHGVSRISINPQTMNEETLRLIGRSHSSEEVLRAMDMAREAGFDFINMDTIIGLPGETPDMVRRTMERLAPLAPENLTVHTLAVKRSSRLKERLGEIPLPAAEEAESMLALCEEAAGRMGLEPYYMYRQKYMRGNLENVGYCRPGYPSAYNIDIMEETTSILALGAGAISKWVYDGGRRIERVSNPKDLKTYLAKSEELFEKRRDLIESAVSCVQEALPDEDD